MLFATTFLVV